jgi:hypothetical protein
MTVRKMKYPKIKWYLVSLTFSHSETWTKDLLKANFSNRDELKRECDFCDAFGEMSTSGGSSGAGASYPPRHVEQH